MIHEKPEVVAPGVNLNPIGVDGIPANEDSDNAYQPINGTSFSAPYVAGLAAQLRQDRPEMTLVPLRSIIMASALNNVDGPRAIPPGSDYQDGAGAVDPFAAEFIAKNHRIQVETCDVSCWWNADVTPSYPQKLASLYYHFNATQGDRIRVAISWNSNADCASENACMYDRLDSDFDLLVRGPDRVLRPDQISARRDNNYELVDFIARETGVFEIQVQRLRDGSEISGQIAETSNKVAIALLRQRQSVVDLPLAFSGFGATTLAQQRSPQASVNSAYPPPATDTPMPTGTPQPYPGPSTPTPTPAPIGGTYPRNGILDTFNRSDGNLGNNWIGDVGGYTIRNRSVEVMGGGSIYFNQTFGINQEVYVTLPSFNTNAAEIDLLLKAQGTGQCDVLEVWYTPSTHTVQVVTCENDQWDQHGHTISLTLAQGDRFGARVFADGTVNIYQNNMLVDSVQVSSTWSYRASAGRVGMWMIDATGGVLEDFGGGTLP